MSTDLPAGMRSAQVARAAGGESANPEVLTTSVAVCWPSSTAALVDIGSLSRSPV